MLDVPLPSSLYRIALLLIAQSSTSERPSNFCKTMFPWRHAFPWWQRPVVALLGVSHRMEESREAHSSADLPVRATRNAAHANNHVPTSILDALRGTLHMTFFVS